MEASYNLRSPAVKRLMREAQELKDKNEQFSAAPLDDNLFEWHFTIRGPSDSDFEEGVYHGRIILPPEYPMKPPSIILLTPNGRFEINKKICLSISGYHPETWLPSWSLRTALLGIIGFMPSHGHGAIGSLDYTPEERKTLAKKSQKWVCSQCGPIKDLVLPTTENRKKLGEEAKKIGSKINLSDERNKSDDTTDIISESTQPENLPHPPLPSSTSPVSPLSTNPSSFVSSPASNVISSTVISTSATNNSFNFSSNSFFPFPQIPPIPPSVSFPSSSSSQIPPNFLNSFFQNLNNMSCISPPLFFFPPQPFQSDSQKPKPIQDQMNQWILQQHQLLLQQYQLYYFNMTRFFPQLFSFPPSINFQNPPSYFSSVSSSFNSSSVSGSRVFTSSKTTTTFTSSSITSEKIIPSTSGKTGTEKKLVTEISTPSSSTVSFSSSFFSSSPSSSSSPSTSKNILTKEKQDLDFPASSTVPSTSDSDKSSKSTPVSPTISSSISPKIINIPKSVSSDATTSKTDTTKDTIKDTTNDTAKDTIKDTTNDTIKDTTKDTTKDTINDTTKDTTTITNTKKISKTITTLTETSAAFPHVTSVPESSSSPNTSTVNNSNSELRRRNVTRQPDANPGFSTVSQAPRSNFQYNHIFFSIIILIFFLFLRRFLLFIDSSD